MLGTLYVIGLILTLLAVCWTIVVVLTKDSMEGHFKGPFESIFLAGYFFFAWGLVIALFWPVSLFLLYLNRNAVAEFLQKIEDKNLAKAAITALVKAPEEGKDRELWRNDHEEGRRDAIVEMEGNQIDKHRNVVEEHQTTDQELYQTLNRMIQSKAEDDERERKWHQKVREKELAASQKPKRWVYNTRTCVLTNKDSGKTYKGSQIKLVDNGTTGAYFEVKKGGIDWLVKNFDIESTESVTPVLHSSSEIQEIDIPHEKIPIIKVHRVVTPSALIQKTSRKSKANSARGKSTKINQAAKISKKDADYFLGQNYEFGNGVEKNHNLAMHHYCKAALAGCAKAYKRIGITVDSDNSDNVNHSLNLMADEWLKKAKSIEQ